MRRLDDVDTTTSIIIIEVSSWQLVIVLQQKLQKEFICWTVDGEKTKCIDEKVFCWFLSTRPVVNFINVLHAHFSYEFWRQSQNVTIKSCHNNVRMKKAREKTSMKLTPVVNFTNIKRTNFLYENSFWQLLLRTCNFRKAAKTTSVCKIHAFNVVEIDTFSQFHPHIYEQLLWTQILQA